MEFPEKFFEEEVRSGYLVTSQMKKVWACQLEILEKFKQVCDKHGLTFWLESGTLIGAVRHKGYIPWDDDIDVCMMREDYDKLVKIAQDEFTHPLVFQTAYTEKDFIRGHAQIRNVNTSAIIPSEIHKRFNQGIFIDVFVLDYVPDNQDEYDFQCLTAFMIRSRLELAATPLRSCKLVHFAHLRKVIRYKLKYFKRAKFLKDFGRYEDLFRGNTPDKCHDVALAAWVYRSHKRDASFYNETIYLDFEGLSMPVPKEYHKLLTVLYGDYMTPVMAASKHGETIISPEIPSDQMIKKLRRESLFKFGL